MATFSTNQVRQLYVVEELKTPSIAENDKVGAIAVKTDADKSHLYFDYMGAGGRTRSDLIEIKNIMSVKVSDADKLAHKLLRYKLTLSSTINSGNPVVGQDYILKAVFKNYIGFSDEDQYFKYGMVHTTSSMTASDFYKTLALSLVRNFSEDETTLLKVYLETGGTAPDTVAGDPVEITKLTKGSDLTGTYTGIVFEENQKEWILGQAQQVIINFTLHPNAIDVDGGREIWGEVKRVGSVNSINNGRNIADLEYFCMGERGDTYRMVGFPNVVTTKYLVNSDNKYNVIDIHYAYVGSNESVQKSEKDITLVIPKIGDKNSESNKLANDIISAINKATGLSIPTLDNSAD